MTMRISNDAGRKAPKVTALVLNRETVQELTDTEAEEVAGGVFRPRNSKSACAGWTKCQCAYTAQIGCTATCASSY